MDSKCNGGGGGGESEGDEGYIVRSPLNANGCSSRKRIKHQKRKVSDVYAPVDPALVPRRLRSAIKRTSQSASPPSSDTKSRQQHASVGTLLFNSSSAERFKQKMLVEVTKDEKEVAEALTSMASLITISKPDKKKEDERMLEENTEKKAPSASPLEENSLEAVKADPSSQEQRTAASVSQKLDAEANVASEPEPDSLRKLSSNVEIVEGVRNLKDALNISNPPGASLQYFPGNGMLQPMQLDALLVRKQELWPLRPDSMEHDLQSLKQKAECVSHDISQKAPDLQPVLHSRGHEKLIMPSSSKAVVYPNSVTVSERPGSRNGRPSEKLSLMPADKKRMWSRCTTHVHISHLIRDNQKAEKKQPSLPHTNQSKAKKGTSYSLPTSGETVRLRNGMIPPLSSTSLVERSMLEARNQMIQDGMLLQAQQAAALSGAYAPQKQGCDLLSLSAAGDTKSSQNGMMSSGQLHVSYPPNQAMPFTFPQGAYTSQYQEQLAAGATLQVQLQLPTYIASGQLYGSHMGQSAGGGASTKQQQQQQQQQLMWQAHLAHYRPQLGFLQKWQQNGQHQDSSSSSSPLLTQLPPSIFPLPAEYNPQPFIKPMPSSSSPSFSRSKQKQQHNGGGLNSQSSSQLQMVCNADSFR